MDNEVLFLYLFAQADAFRNTFTGGTILAAMFVVFIGLGLAIGELSRSAEKWFKVAIASTLAGSLVLALIPDRTGLAIIAGGIVASRIAKSDAASEIGSEVLEAIRKQLREAASSK